MRSVEAGTTIGAPVETVWALLTDGAALARGGLGILRIEGAIGPGQRFRLWSAVAPQRPFTLTVAAFAPPLAMDWVGGMPFGLFRGVRRFRLAALPEGCSFHMREEFTGPLLPLIWRSMPDLAPSFRQFAEGLRTLAEA